MHAAGVDAGLAPRRRRAARTRGRVRLAVLAAVLLVAAVVGGWAALRSSSVFAVRAVTVDGLDGPRASEVESTAAELSRGQGLLRLDVGAVADAVGRLPYVRAVTVDRAFPNTLAVFVEVYRPRAVIVMPGRDGGYLLAAGGEVIGHARRVPSGLPRIVLPAGSTVVVGQVTGDANVKAALHVLHAAPRSFVQDFGPFVELRPAAGQVQASVRAGTVLRLGEATAIETKLRVAQRVVGQFTEQQLRSTAYVDVTVPERPALGMR